jgi:phage-related protein
MTDTFSFPVNVTKNTTGATTLRVKGVQFGDGYSQAAGDGLNNKSQSWPIECVGTDAQIKAIEDFLDAHGGHTSFNWTTPRGAQALFRCPSYNSVPLGGGIFQLTATFAQSFAP